MTKETFESALHSFDHRAPFDRFLVQLTSGEILAVVHPEAMALRGDVIVFVTPARRYHLFDSASVCQLMDPQTA